MYEALPDFDKKIIEKLRDDVNDFVLNGNPNKNKSNLDYLESLYARATSLLNGDATESDNIDSQIIEDIFSAIESAKASPENDSFFESSGGTATKLNAESTGLSLALEALTEYEKVLPSNIYWAINVSKIVTGTKYVM